MSATPWLALAIPAIREAVVLFNTFNRENGRDPSDEELTQILSKATTRRDLNARLEESLETRMGEEAQPHE